MWYGWDVAEQLASFEGITLRRARSVSLTLYLDSPTDVKPVEVIVDVAQRQIDMASYAIEWVLAGIREAVGVALELPVQLRTGIALTCRWHRSPFPGPQLRRKG
jgi:hypothetical protein